MTLAPIKKSASNNITKIVLKVLVGILFTSVMLSAVPTKVRAEGYAPTIIGGEKAAEGAYPWAVAIMNTEADSRTAGHFCGGTLIAPQWVLTAAHCAYYGAQVREVSTIGAIIGATTLSQANGEPIGISEIIIHPKYDRATATFDIALIRLESASTSQVAPLVNAAWLPKADLAGATVMGWGKTTNEFHSDALMHVNVPVVDSKTCQQAYSADGYTINDSMLCAGLAAGGQDACVGDSGGPLVAPLRTEITGEVSEWGLIGVVSWGKGCAEANAYGVYSDVGASMQWIFTHVDNAEAAGLSEVESQGSAQETMQVFMPLMMR